MRLIDAEVLYNKVRVLEDEATETLLSYIKKADTTEWKVWSAILSERTAFKHEVADATFYDAVCVVRCKNCVYSKLLNVDDDVYTCDINPQGVHPGDGYCHMGEER